MRITVLGAGYVGLVTGACLAEMGHDVICHDIHAPTIARLQQNDVPFYESGLEAMVQRQVTAKRLSFRSHITECLSKTEMCFVAVNTPADDTHRIQVNNVLDAATAVATHALHSVTLVIKSTVPVGTSQAIQSHVDRILQARGANNIDIDVVSNPEFLKEGHAISDFMMPDRIVVGTSSTSQAARLMRTLYEPMLRNKTAFLVMDLASAEMTKLAANVMLATRIALINELANICTSVGADIMHVRQGVGTDHRIGAHFLSPGLGYGGSCFPRDVLALAHLGQDAQCPTVILSAVHQANRIQRKILIRYVRAHFGHSLASYRFAVWGLAYKPGTDDVREAPALDLICDLATAGAHVIAFDPRAMHNAKRILQATPSIASHVSFAETMYSALDQVDALLLATEWPEFIQPDFIAMKTRMKRAVIFDGRNQYDPSDLKELGFHYVCIGRT